MSSSDDTPGDRSDYTSILTACLKSTSQAEGMQDKRSPAGMVVAEPYGAYPGQPMGQPMMGPAQPMVVQPGAVPPMAVNGQPMVAMPMAPPQPVVVRPPVIWMPAPGTVPGCPAGLEYLTMVDQIIVEQLVEMLEVFTGIETANRYVIRNAMGQQIYYAMEMSTQDERNYYGEWRAFTMVITDNAMREIIRVHRPNQPCCSYAEAYIEAPPGAPIGYIKGTYDGFTIFDPARAPILEVIRPSFIDKNDRTIFGIQTTSGEAIGMMVKHYGGYLKEATTNADTFSLQFPLDLTAQMKAVLLACVFMVDFRWFEDKHKYEDDSYGYGHSNGYGRRYGHHY